MQYNKTSGQIPTSITIDNTHHNRIASTGGLNNPSRASLSRVDLVK